MNSPYGNDPRFTGGHQPAPFSDEAVGDDSTSQIPGSANPYGQTGFAQHAYSQPAPTYGPNAPTSPFGNQTYGNGQPYADQPYGPPGVPPMPYGQPPKKSSVGMILGIVGAIAVIVVIGIVAGIALSGDDKTKTVATPSTSVTTTRSTQLSTTPSGDSGTTSGQETEFKAGGFAQTPPPAETQTSTFLTGYATGDDWLRNKVRSAEFTAVFTSDTTYNSGMTTKPADSTPYAAAAYKPQYYKTIFIYWTPTAEADLKEFMLAFGYSGALQWWEHFDVMQSASKQLGSARITELNKVLNSDAVCRVLSWGGYSQSVADRLGGCPTTSWTESWLQQQIQALGVTITDY